MKTPLFLAACLFLSTAATSLAALVYDQNFNSAGNGTTGTGLGDGTNIVSNNSTARVHYQSDGFGGGWRALRLTQDGVNSDTANFYLPDFDPGLKLDSFTVDFTLLIRATGTAGDEFSFNIGDFKNTTTPFNGIGLYSPPANSGSMLSVLWDTYNSGGSDPNSIEVFYNGSSVANNTSVPPTIYAGGLTFAEISFKSVSVSWDSGSGLSVSYGGSSVFTNLSVPGFNPAPGYQFGFGAWTGGGASQGIYIDNLTINTTASAAAVPEPGQIAASLLLLTALATHLLLKRRPTPTP
jgi:hypothetical protein